MRRTVVAIDVGGMSIKRGVVVIGGRDGADVELRSPRHIDATAERDVLLGELGRAIGPVVSQVDEDGDGSGGRIPVGIAFPGPMDYAAGIPLMRGQRKFDSLYAVNLRDWLSERSDAWSVRGLDVRFVNDAQAAALGEDCCGAAAAVRRSLTVTLGTGFGASAVIDGRAVETLGSLAVPTLFERAVGGAGRADDVLSAVGLARQLGVEPDELPAAARDARRGDGRLRNAFGRFGLLLGEFLGRFLVTTGVATGVTTGVDIDIEIDMVVVGGGGSKAFDLFGPSLSRELMNHTPGVVAAPALLGSHAPLIGAASLWTRTPTDTG